MFRKLEIENFGTVVIFLQRASLFIQRFEKKYGKDENSAIPRCLMAAKFISPPDPSGEKTLKHWIQQGQIQDLNQVFRTLQLPVFFKIARLQYFKTCCPFQNSKTLRFQGFKISRLQDFKTLRP